jgi:DNA polymerase-1
MSGPNLQQLSKRGEGKKVRRIFIPEKGHDLILSIDWSAMELRMAAHMSQDHRLLDAYAHDKDLHCVTGSGLMGVPYEEMYQKAVVEGDPEYKVWRQRGKTLNFAGLYNAQANRLAAYDLLDCSVAEAEQYLRSFKTTYSKFFYDYYNEVKRDLKTKQMVQTLFGRPRYFPNANSPIKALANEAFNAGINHTIQGSCAELMRVAMANLYDQELLYSEGIHFIAPVHDEFVWSVRVDKLEDLAKKAVKIMTAVPDGFTVPMDVGVSIGLNFADQHEVTLDNLMDKAKELLNV